MMAHGPVTTQFALGSAYALHLWARGLDSRGRPQVDRSEFYEVPQADTPIPNVQWHEMPLDWGSEDEPAQQDAPGVVINSGVGSL
jgi:hypothetical protein